MGNPFVWPPIPAYVPPAVPAVGPVPASSPINLTDGAANRWQTIVTAVAAVGFVDLLGPAAGYVRFYDSFYLLATAASGPATAFLQPANRQIANLAGVTNNAFITRPTVIGPGESIRITNNSGVNPFGFMVNYLDVPNTAPVRFTLIRQDLTAVPVNVVPAPVSGYRRLGVLASWGAGSSSAPSQVLSGFNRDTVAGLAQIFFQGIEVMRTNNAAALAIPFYALPFWSEITALTGAMTARMLVAPTTNSPFMHGCYESFP